LFEDKELLEVFEENKSPLIKNLQANNKAEKQGIIVST
jgi:hypothetical protein